MVSWAVRPWPAVGVATPVVTVAVVLVVAGGGPVGETVGVAVLALLWATVAGTMAALAAPTASDVAGVGAVLAAVLALLVATARLGGSDVVPVVSVGSAVVLAGVAWGARRHGRGRPRPMIAVVGLLLLVAAAADRWGTGIVLLAVAAAPSLLLRPTDRFDPARIVALRRWSAVQAWAQSTAVGAVAHGVVSDLGDRAPWTPWVGQAAAAAAFALGFAATWRAAESAWPVGQALDLSALVSAADAVSWQRRSSEDVAGVADELRSALGLDSVVVVIEIGPGRRIEVGVPRDVGGEDDRLTLGVMSGRDRVGSLTVTGHPGVVRLSRPVLENVAGLLGQAASAADLNAELAAVRDRLLRARDEERSALQRELTVGLVPAVRAVADDLEDAVAMADEQPDRALEVVRSARERLGRCASDVRVLARSMVPTTLESGGLGAALRELGRSGSGAGLTWEIDDEAHLDLEPAAQVAVYLVVVDVVAALERTGEGDRDGERHVSVRLRADADALRLTLRLAGPALPPEDSRHLRDVVQRRVAELGLGVRGVDQGQGVELEIPR